MEQLVARQAHNLEVARSSRTPATTKREEAIGFLLSFCLPISDWNHIKKERTLLCKMRSCFGRYAYLSLLLKNQQNYKPSSVNQDTKLTNRT